MGCAASKVEPAASEVAKPAVVTPAAPSDMPMPVNMDDLWLPKLVDDMFSRLDLDGDGVVSKAELMSHVMRSGMIFPEARMAGDEELQKRAADIFAELDVDQSGGLSKQELTDGLGLYAAKHEGAREALEQQLGAGTLSMYFGYGSNMSPEGMASKGLTPLRSYRAVLHGYQLCFNLRTVGLCDPSFANVEPCAGAEVHGVAIAFSAEDMKRLDGFEASYDRVTVPVSAYSEDGGATYLAEVYVFNQSTLDSKPFLKGMMSVSEHPPSQRYLNMLTSGGRKMKLDDAYVAALEAHPVSSLPSLAEYLTPAVKEAIASKRFTMDEVERSAQEEGAAKLMVLKGVVFTCHPAVKRDFGKDVTLFECLRVRVIESLAEIGDDHKEWVNAALAEKFYFGATPMAQKAGFFTVMGQTNYDEYDW